MLNRIKNWIQNIRENLFLKAYRQRVKYELENAWNYMTIMHGNNLSPNAKFTLLPMIVPMYFTTFFVGLGRIAYTCTIGLITNAICLYLETKMKAEFVLSKIAKNGVDKNAYNRLYNIFLIIDKHAHTSDPTIIFDSLKEFSKLKLADDETLGNKPIKGEHTVAEAITSIQNYVFNNSKRAHALSNGQSNSNGEYMSHVKSNFARSIAVLTSMKIFDNSKNKSTLEKLASVPVTLVYSLAKLIKGLGMLTYHSTVGWLTTYIGLAFDRSAASPYWNRVKYNFNQAFAVLTSMWSLDSGKTMSTPAKVVSAPFWLAGNLATLATAIGMLAYHSTFGWLTTYIGLSIERAAYVDYAMQKRSDLSAKDKLVFRDFYETLYDIIDIENHTLDPQTISAALGKLSTMKVPGTDKSIGSIKLDQNEQPESYSELCNSDNVARIKASFFAKPALTKAVSVDNTKEAAELPTMQVA